MKITKYCLLFPFFCSCLVATPQQLQVKPSTDQEYAANVLAILNRVRIASGLKPVALDETLSRACAGHAQYLVAHITPDQDPHGENPALSGFTKEGNQCGENSVIISAVPPDEGVNYFLATFFHRIPLLDPGLRRIGFGFARGGSWGYATVIDIFSAVEQTGTEFVIFPGIDQTNVPLTFGLFRKGVTVNEYPDPLPDDKDKIAGYPVTITFTRSQQITSVKATMTNERGDSIECWIYTPEHPAVDKDYQQNSIVLLAKDQLQKASRYTVTIEALVNEKKFSKSWSFTTVSD